MLGQKMSKLLSEVQPLQKMSKLLSEVQAQLPGLSNQTKISDLTLDSLPDEVLLEILERVPQVWLVASVSRVSKRLRRLVRHRSLWVRVDLSNIAGKVHDDRKPVCTNTASCFSKTCHGAITVIRVQSYVSRTPRDDFHWQVG